MAVLVLVAVLLVHLVVGAQHALVTDDALALFDGLGGEHAVAVDGRQAGGDLLFWHCVVPGDGRKWGIRSEEHTSELQSLMRISYAVVCLNKIINETHTI